VAAFAYHCYFRARNLEGVGGSSIRVPDRVHKPGVPQSRFDDVYRAPSHRARGSISLAMTTAILGRFLRPLQAPRRWILKSPEHVFSIDALTGVFPDAMLVLTHRDPGHVRVSAARVTELLRAPSR
jgi:Sulfotransferase family